MPNSPHPFTEIIRKLDALSAKQDKVDRRYQLECAELDKQRESLRKLYEQFDKEARNKLGMARFARTDSDDTMAGDLLKAEQVLLKHLREIPEGKWLRGLELKQVLKRENLDHLQPAKCLDNAVLGSRVEIDGTGILKRYRLRTTPVDVPDFVRDEKIVDSEE